MICCVVVYCTSVPNMETVQFKLVSHVLVNFISWCLDFEIQQKLFTMSKKCRTLNVTSFDIKSPSALFFLEIKKGRYDFIRKKEYIARANQVQEKTTHAPEKLPPLSTSGPESKTLDVRLPLGDNAKPAAPLQDGTAIDLDSRPPEVSTELPPSYTPSEYKNVDIPDALPNFPVVSTSGSQITNAPDDESLNFNIYTSADESLYFEDSPADVHTELMTPSSGRLSPTTLVDPEAGGSFLMPDYETEVDFLSDDIFDFTASSLLSNRSGQSLMPDFSEATEEDRSGEEILSILTKYTQFCLLRKTFYNDCFWEIFSKFSQNFALKAQQMFFLPSSCWGN